MLVVFLLAFLALASSTLQMKMTSAAKMSMIKDSEILQGQHLRVSAFHVSIFHLLFKKSVVNHLIMRA
jgi:hypothetical protein